MFPYTEAQCKHGGTDGSTSCTNYYNYYYFPQCDLVADNGRSKKNIKSMNINTKATSGHHYHEHVHHHHHRHHKDDVESFKQQSLRVRKRRKRFPVFSSSHFLFLLQSSSLHAWQATGFSEVGCGSGFCSSLDTKVLSLSWCCMQEISRKQHRTSPFRKKTRTFGIQKTAVSPESL